MSSNLRLLLLMTILTNKLKTIYLRNNNLQLFRNTETLVKHNFVFKMDKFLVCVGIVGNYPSSEVIQVETLFGEALKKNENDIKKYMEERLATILTTGFLPHVSG